MKKNIILLYVITSLYWFSMYCYSSEFSLYAIALGASIAQVGVITGSYGITQFLCRLPIGIFSDTLKKRKIFIVLGILLSLVCASLLIFFPTLENLYVFKILCGVSASCWTIFTVTYTSYFKIEETTKAIGLIKSAHSLGQISGVLIGGIIVSETNDPHSLFFVSFCAAFLSLCLTIKLEEVPFVGKAKKVDEIVSIIKDKTLLYYSCIAIFIQLSIHGISYAYGPVIAEELGMNGFYRSVFVALGILPSVLCTPILNPWLIKKLKRKITLTLGFFLLGTAILLMPHAINSMMLCGYHFIFGIGISIIFPLTMSYSIENISTDVRGTAMSVFQAIYSLGTIGGPIFLGIVIDSFDMNVAFSIVSAGCILIAASIFYQNKISSS